MRQEFSILLSIFTTEKANSFAQAESDQATATGKF